MDHGRLIHAKILAAHRRCSRFLEPHVGEMGKCNLLARLVEVFDNPFGIRAAQLRAVGNDNGYRVSPLRVGDDAGALSA